MNLISSKNLYPIRKALSLATEISPYMPQRGEGLIRTAVKLFAVADKIQEFFGSHDALEDFLRREEPNTVRYEGQLFVELCLNTPVTKSFKTQKTKVDDTIEVLKFTTPHGNIYVIFYLGMFGPMPNDSFYVTAGFDFDAMLHSLWQYYDSNLYISSEYSASKSRIRSKYLPLVFSDDPIAEAAAEKLKKVSERHRVYLSKGYSRTYLLEGPPGVGKTTFAMRFAKMCGERILRIDSQGLAYGGADMMNLFLSGLKPDFLLIEDVDRVVNKETLSVILDALTNFKERFPKVTIVMTANHIGSIDSAVKRPGRIDRVLRFSPPNGPEREQILETYYREFGIEAPIEKALVETSQGLTAACLKEVAIQVNCGEDTEDILESIQVMKNLLKEESDDSDDDEDEALPKSDP